MTDEQINKTIAEACRWTSVREVFEDVLGRPPNSSDLYCRVPNYAGCLNAMHEAVMTLTMKKRSKFRNQLQYLIAPSTKPNLKVSGIKVMGSDHYDEWFNATARQRAEAFLRTIGKWEDEA
jgi:hypothetical protein